jgi:hypothetical protein
MYFVSAIIVREFTFITPSDVPGTCESTGINHKNLKHMPWWRELAGTRDWYRYIIICVS